MTRYYIISTEGDPYVVAETVDESWADAANTWESSVILDRDTALLDPSFREAAEAWEENDDRVYAAWRVVEEAEMEAAEVDAELLLERYEGEDVAAGLFDAWLAAIGLHGEPDSTERQAAEMRAHVFGAFIPRYLRLKEMDPAAARRAATRLALEIKQSGRLGRPIP
jgi:hypothetical protein